MAASVRMYNQSLAWSSILDCYIECTTDSVCCHMLIDELANQRFNVFIAGDIKNYRMDGMDDKVVLK